MVILDTKNKTYGVDTNILYLSLYDIDYLVSKFGLDALREVLPESYIEGFQMILDLVKGEEELSIEYYSLAPLVITNDETELLNIICDEISRENMYTKNQLHDLAKENLDCRISELDKIKKENGELTPEELYKLRSFKLIDFVEKARKKAKTSDYNIFNGTEGSMEIRKKIAENDYEKYTAILQSIGLTDIITESDYFKDYIPSSRKQTN